MPFPYQDNHIPKSAPLVEKYQQLKQEYLSNKTDTLIAWRNFTNQKILLAIADDLIIRNALGAYVVNGIAHDYLFQDAIIQISENQVQVCRWCETARNNVEIKYLQGRISWQKVINCIYRDGFTPDDNLPPDLLADLRNSFGRFLTIYAVTPEDGTWTRIFSGSRRLLAHKIYAAMSRIVRANNKNYG